MTSKLLSLLAAAVLAGGCMQASTETREPVGSPGERVVGYSFYPQRRTPTPEQLSSLHLPVGFAADVFARDLLIAVSSSRTFPTRASMSIATSASDRTACCTCRSAATATSAANRIPTTRRCSG
jgi:hypothetical protein